MTTISVLPDQIIRECRRRIEARYPPTVATVLVGDGGEPATAMMLEIERLRACQDHLLAMTPLPATYPSDHHWQGYPPGFRFQTFVSQVAAPAVQAAPVAPPQPVYQPAPQVTQPQIIVIPSGGQQMVYGGPNGYTPGQQPMPSGAGTAPVHFVPPPDMGVSPYAVEPMAATHAASAPAPTPAILPPAASEPPIQTAKVEPPPQIWNARKEAMYSAAARALDGDAASIDLLTPFAAEIGIDLRTFCQRVVSERARTFEVWKLMEGAV